VTYATIDRGRCLMTHGQAREGLALLTQGLAATRATGAVAATPITLMWAAEAHAMLGQSSEALDRLAEATQLIEATEERCHEAELHRLRGYFFHRAGDLSAAEQDYHRSLEIAQSQSAKIFELRTSTCLARLWCEQGRRAEARDHLASIYNWFTGGFDAPDLKEAKALLEQLAPPRGTQVWT
jgi:predicted ATPase